MMVVETEAEFICWCWCHGRLVTVRRAISCKECVELCMKEEAKRIEYHCYRATQPEEEIEYE